MGSMKMNPIKPIHLMAEMENLFLNKKQISAFSTIFHHLPSGNETTVF
jgi:hypothetical protein